MAPRAPRVQKSALIVQAALEILRDEGERGLSMRGLANRLGMSLSNVQYYFQDKDSLLCAMVAHYFEACAQTLEHVSSELAPLTSSECRRRLLRTSLHHGHEMTEMCRIFREIWSIGARNQAVANALDTYYLGVAQSMSAMLLDSEAPDTLRRRVELLLVPYMEGYSITGRALAHGPEEAVEMLTELIEKMERGESKRRS